MCVRVCQSEARQNAALIDLAIQMARIVCFEHMHIHQICIGWKLAHSTVVCVIQIAQLELICMLIYIIVCN